MKKLQTELELSEKRSRGRPKGSKNKKYDTEKLDRRVNIFDILNLPLTMTIKEASEKFGPSTYAISAAIKSNKILAVQSGNHYEISTWDFVEKFNLFPKELFEKVLQARLKEMGNQEKSA